MKAEIFAVVTAVSLFSSCVKEHFSERFKPAETDLCTDNILNNGEYFTDCGGPCAPCPAASPTVSFRIDSTWKNANPNTPVVNSDYVEVSYSAGFINLTAADTFSNKSEAILISFGIGKTWGPGVHISDEMTGDEYLYCAPPGSPPGLVYLENGGIISITNYDEKNELMSGEFSFNCQPDGTTGYRAVVFNGKFRDIPIKP